MKKLFLLFLALLSPVCRAEKSWVPELTATGRPADANKRDDYRVLQAGVNEGFVFVVHGRKPWEIGERICLTYVNGVTQCGKVVATDKRGARVGLYGEPRKFRPNEQVLVSRGMAAPEDFAEGSSARMLRAFRVGPVFMVQRFGSPSLAFATSWNPTFPLTPSLGLRLALGFLVGTKNTGQAFIVLDNSVLFAYPRAGHWQLELGLGAETWIDYGGTRPTGTAALSYRFGDSQGFSLDRVVLGYTSLFDTNFIQQIRMAVELAF